MVTRKEGIDPITMEVIKNSLSSIIDQMALVMTRAAYSPLLRDLFDFSTGLTDAKGRILAEGLVNPVMAGVFPSFIQVVSKLWSDRIYPGDVFIGNDPYEGASHLPDVYIVRPIFMNSSLVAYVCTTAHQLDFGGRVPGSNACDNTEIYQEGLRIPPLKYYERGVRNHSIYQLIKKNVRISDMVTGDIEAQVAATGIGERGLTDLAEKYGDWSILSRYLDELMDYSERMTRAAIRKLPDGIYEFEDFLDDDGFIFEPVRIFVKVIVDEDNITFDFTGSSPTVKGSINLPLSSTIALINAAVRLFLDVTVPSNAGVHRPVKIIAPYDTIMNLGFPSGCAGRGATMGRVWDTIVGALSKIAPDKIPAANAEVDFGICLSGTNQEGNPFVFTEFLIGSWGGRPWADGIDVASPPWLNYSNIPCEVIEKEYPIRIEKYTFVPDTGGAGKYRGGLGVIREYHILANDVVCQWRQDRALFPPWGLNGGKPGGVSRGYHISDGNKRELKKSVFFCKKGDVLQAILPGGGGYGNPLERDVDAILDDVRNEKISIKSAESDYGVVINDKTMRVDNEATKQLRKKMRTASKTGVKSKKRGDGSALF